MVRDVVSSCFLALCFFGFVLVSWVVLKYLEGYLSDAPMRV